LLTFHFITLGCPRNQIDSDWIKGTLLKHNFKESSYEEADCILVNTCSFILPAKKESIETILEVCEQRKEAKVYVLGCLAKRYGKEIFAEIPEVEGVISPDFYPLLPEIILNNRKRVLKTSSNYSFLYADPKVVSTFPFAYVKLSEGCSNFCSYCAIPQIRGPLRSRSVNEVEIEVKKLVEADFKEIVLVAQDTTAFGLDRGKKELPELLNRLSIFEGIWIRLLYLHPEKIDEELIGAISSSPNVLPYFDLPIQHASPKILKKMGRNPDIERLINKVKFLRSVFPEGFIRFTVMVGFPGESEKDLELLSGFLKEAKPDYTGVFEYSEEEKTAAYKLKEKVPEEEKKRRAELISRLSEELTFQRLETFLKADLQVLVERSEDNLSFGRFYGQAPEIDGEVIFPGREKRGEWKRVKIGERVGFDLAGEAF
jgi:ribosomal protein S12 methylthiotransferase